MHSMIQWCLYIVGGFFLLYLLIYASYLALSVIAGAYRLYKQDRMRAIRNELKHDYYYPISILVPAHNEEVTIVESIESLLRLKYRLFEIIIVDDGSTDNTVKILMDHFKMIKTERPIHRQVQCKPYKAIYEATIHGIDLTLVEKLNGGKGDALNMGINVSKFPWFVCMDADSFLQADSLEKIMQPVLGNENAVAVGGMVRVSQGLKLENYEIADYHLPKKPIVCMQVMEYERSFLASRILMDMFNGNLIISGAFGLFKKDIVIAMGGYDTSTLGEDMELVVKMHIFCRNNSIPYAILYEPTAICWSEAPGNLKDLCKQRRRWHLGLFQSMIKYRQMMINPRFGMLGFVSYLYYLLYELLSPFIELAGMLFTLLFWFSGVLNLKFTVYFLLIYGIYGACLTITAFFQSIYAQKLKLTPLDVSKATLACILESLFFRYFVAFTRTTAFIGYKKKKSEWGSIQRFGRDVNDSEERNVSSSIEASEHEIHS